MTTPRSGNGPGVTAQGQTAERAARPEERRPLRPGPPRPPLRSRRATPARATTCRTRSRDIGIHLRRCTGRRYSTCSPRRSSTLRNRSQDRSNRFPTRLLARRPGSRRRRSSARCTCTDRTRTPARSSRNTPRSRRRPSPAWTSSKEREQKAWECSLFEGKRTNQTPRKDLPRWWISPARRSTGSGVGRGGPGPGRLPPRPRTPWFVARAPGALRAARRCRRRAGPGPDDPRPAEGQPRGGRSTDRSTAARRRST